VAGSFRDPSGTVFRHDGTLYRTVMPCYREHYDRLMSSGLYDALVEAKRLVPHQEVSLDAPATSNAYKVLQPQLVPFISYPYEWCFGQWKEAALLTLHITKRALEHGLILKDASAFNVQFVGHRPVFIDTLSFETYVEGTPWVAYRQFCQHFLAPLALMSQVDIRLGQWSRVDMDGVPLDLAARLLPWRTRWNLRLGVHVHLHSRVQRQRADTGAMAAASPSATKKVSHLGLQGILDSLTASVRKLAWEPRGTTWGEYYSQTNYSPTGFARKQELVREYLTQLAPRRLFDLGANTGEFSYLACEQGVETISFDVDPAAVEQNFRHCRHHKLAGCLPLLMDLTNPSPALGWNLTERSSLRQRGPADAIMALALVHHLAIANNVPLEDVASSFRALGRDAIVEFVPKQDSQVVRMLATRQDVFPNYTREGFERAMQQAFQIERCEPIADTQRLLYLLRGR
jgi:ribosomal protein L11 methylase PrmA